MKGQDGGGVDIWPAFSDFLSSSLLLILLFLVVTLVSSTFQRNLLSIERARLAIEKKALETKVKFYEEEQQKRRARSLAIDKVKERRKEVRNRLSRFKVDPPDEQDEVEITWQTIILQDAENSKTQDFFKSGEATLTPALKAKLDVVERVLSDNEHYFSTIRVDGHTDDDPIEEGNWLLSSKRAAAVVDYMLRPKRIKPWKIAATGRAEYQPQTLRDELTNQYKAPGTNEANQSEKGYSYVNKANKTEALKAENRRIEIRIDYDLEDARRAAEMENR